MQYTPILLVAIIAISLIGSIITGYVAYKLLSKLMKAKGDSAQQILNLFKEVPPVYTLRRREFDFGCYGYLYDSNDNLVCMTVEQPWNYNIKNESAIPYGVYLVQPWVSPSKGDCYIISNPNLGVTKTEEEGGERSECLIHVANTPSELRGCIAPGSDFGYVNGEWAVINSGVTFNSLLELFDGKPFLLNIVKD